MSDQLPAILLPTAIVTPTNTTVVPALIANVGDAAGWRYIEFFSANVHNPHTRRAYGFFGGCEQRILTAASLFSLRRPTHRMPPIITIALDGSGTIAVDAISKNAAPTLKGDKVALPLIE